MRLDFDSIQEVLDTALRNKLRTLLTALGIFWGIFMLIAMIGFGNGLQQGTRSQMAGFATNSVYVWGQKTSLPYRGMQPGRWIQPELQDVEALKQLAGVEYLVPRNQWGGFRSSKPVVYQTRSGGYSVMGDYPDYFKIALRRVLSGRLLNELDVTEERKVAVIGKNIADELFEGKPALGEYIQVAGMHFQVIGVIESRRKGSEGDRDDSTLHIPFTTFQKTFNFGNKIQWFALTALPDFSAQKLEDQIKSTLKKRHNIHPDDNRAIGAFNAKEMFGKVTRLFLVLRALIWFVGLLTLLAGAIGVSNIMLVVIKERTREIGLRRAVGATPIAIILQTLFESVFLTAIAGAVGFIAAFLFLELFGAILMWTGGGDGALAPPHISLSIGLFATSVIVLFGLIAGILPALQAVNIRPIEALRTE